jgi:hypothetical protein
MAARCDGAGRWSLASLSTHTSDGALGRTSLVVGRAAKRDTFMRVRQARRGVMLLGATHSRADMMTKVKLM